MAEVKELAAPDRPWTNRKLPLTLAFLLVLLIGFAARFSVIIDWHGSPEKAFFQGEPLLTNSDGYFYLSLARDLAEGRYEQVDNKRAVPDLAKRPFPPPLLSVITAGIHRATPFSFNWIAVVLPTLLGLLLAIPLYLFGSFYGGRLMGLLAALFGLLSHYYVYRSSLGFYDTDCLNVTWALSAAYCFLRFGTSAGRRRYLYLCLGLVIYGLSLWWWDQARQVATIITLLPFLVALLFFYRPTRKEMMIFAGVVLLLAGVFFSWQGLKPLIKARNEVIGKFHYISKGETGSFPNTGISIKEQQKPTLNDLVDRTTDSKFALFLSILGLGWLFVRKPKESLFISVPFLISLLAVFFARRLMIFCAPVLALGMSFLLVRLWDLRKDYRFLTFALPLLLIAALTPSIYQNLTMKSWPLEVPVFVEGLTKAKQVTPDNAVIWSWWDDGYRTRYWADRATIADGSVHGPERVVYNALPLATSDFRLAANFMQFYANRGIPGIHQLYSAIGDQERGLEFIKQILAAGPSEGLTLMRQANLKPVAEWQTADDWLRFFYPVNRRPLYLFLDTHQVYSSYWWYWFGTWSIAKQTGTHLLSMPFVGEFNRRSYTYSGRSLFDNSPLNVNLTNGTGMLGKNQIVIHQGTINTGNEVRNHIFMPYGLYFTLYPPTDYAVLADPQFARTVFYQMYSQQKFPKQYFTPVLMQAPAYQLFEVHGDTLEQSTKASKKP